MATISTRRGNFLMIVVTLMSVFIISFGVHEYQREYHFRCDILDAKLQLNNYHPSDPSIRVTIIDTLGNVLSDSFSPDPKSMGNHLHRKEVSEALDKGTGYDIKRTSETNGEKYFYSATFFPDRGVIVRSSVPYSAPLTDSLSRDYTFFFYTSGILLLIAAVMYLRLRLRNSEEEKLRIKRQLTENAAHELKTPAATIEGYLETLVNNPDMPEQTRDSFIERCYTQSKRMSRLLSDMNTLTLMDYSDVKRPETEVDLSAILRQISDETRTQFEQKGIELKLDIPKSIKIQGDPTLLYSLCRNIFDNTLAYASGANFFSVKATVRNASVLLQFSDNGPGVPEEHLKHIFERFYRVDKGRSRRLGGTGLGLSIVKNISVQYGGSASAYQTPGGGLTIEIKMSLTK